MSAGSDTELVIARGDPEEARRLLEASHAMMMALFNPEANHFLGLDELRDPGIAFFIAWAGDRAIGCGALATREGYGEIKSMFVEPDARGVGVAGGLLAGLEAEAAARGLPLLRLETGNLLEAAQALYRRHGFAECGPFGDYPAHPHSVFMEKRLG